MSGAPIIGTFNKSLNRTVMHCTSNICECLAEKIEELLNNTTTHNSGTKGLKQLFQEQTQKGAAGPGTGVWNEHQQKFSRQQQNLRDHLDEYDSRNCGGGGGSPVPADARRWANRPLPTASDWGVNNPTSTPYTGLTGSAAGDAAAAVGAVGVGYAAYRVVRMIPSLFPALWWTIPANAAVP
jgi:hypothetical protein